MPALVASEEASASFLSHLVLRTSIASFSLLYLSFHSNPSPYLFCILVSTKRHLVLYTVILTLTDQHSKRDPLLLLSYFFRLF